MLLLELVIAPSRRGALPVTTALAWLAIPAFVALYFLCTAKAQAATKKSDACLDRDVEDIAFWL